MRQRGASRSVRGVTNPYESVVSLGKDIYKEFPGHDTNGTSMRLIARDYGPHEEATPLNPGFSEELWRLKLTIEIGQELSLEFRKRLPQVIGRLAVLFPALPNHKCCGSSTLIETLLSLEGQSQCGAPDRGAAADVAHVFEHVLIDTISSLSGVRRCSGITCGHKEPEHRFDLFVECPNERLGNFASSLALLIVPELPEPGANYSLYSRSIGLARLIARKKMRVLALSTLAQEVNWTVEEIEDTLRLLSDLGYIAERQYAMNFSGTRSFEVLTV
ncbi:MAG: hypothetical protein QME66_00520 [Candidatus Eisenbacteria bacterium]|nr:hypothetical protein [Candidatus Eisenbacteria bacterium]